MISVALLLLRKNQFVTQIKAVSVSIFIRVSRLQCECGGVAWCGAEWRGGGAWAEMGSLEDCLLSFGISYRQTLYTHLHTKEEILCHLAFRKRSSEKKLPLF